MFAMTRSSFRLAMAAAGALLLALMGSAAPAVAAPPAFTFQVDLGSTSLDGTGPPNDTVLLVLRDHAGFVKDRLTATTDASGDLDFGRGLVAFIENGDSIRATDGVAAHARTFVIPRIAASIDRVTNIVKGLGPPGESVDLTACVATAFDSCSSVGPYTVPVDSSGHWTYDFSPNNLRGQDEVDIDWSDGVGDSVTRELLTPFVSVIFGGNSFIGTAGRGSLVGMSLRDRHGTLKAKTQVSASAFAFFGSQVLFFGEWRKQAYPVNIRAGDRIVGTYASDATMTVPDVVTTPHAGTDRISGHCFNNAYFAVEAIHNDSSGDSASYDGTTGANGFFNIDITTNAPAYDLKSDDLIFLECENNRGDVIGNTLFGLIVALDMNASQVRFIRHQMAIQ
jgi:hypothetical protein